MTTLRRTVDVVCILSAVGLLGGLGAWQLEQTQGKTDEQKLAVAVQDFDRVLKMRAATKDVELNGRGWPVTIDPSWFQDEAPRNPLVSPDRPWVEIAPPEDADLSHPHVRVTLDERFASFWYNPYQGIVRARVPLRINDELSLALYNQVNGTTLTSLYEIKAPTKAAAAPAPVTTGTEVPIVPPAFSEDEMDPTKPSTPPPQVQTPDPSPAPTPSSTPVHTQPPAATPVPPPAPKVAPLKRPGK